MTTDQANKFVAEVLRGLWSRWTPNDEEIRGWTDRLVQFDYGRAQKAVNDLYFDTTSRVSPPPKKVLAVLYDKAVIRSSSRNTGPITIFSLIRMEYFNDESKPDFIYAKNFCVGLPKDVPCKEEIKRIAENTRGKMNDFYGGNGFIVILPKIEGKDSDGENS